MQQQELILELQAVYCLPCVVFEGVVREYLSDGSLMVFLNLALKLHHHLAVSIGPGEFL